MTGNAPLVSVIIPAFNAERTIGETVKSVLSQTLADVEILVVDDGSRDTTPSIIHALAEYDRRVNCLGHEGRSNRGVSASRNLALDAARGQYIGFLDADDTWLPEKLEQQVSALEQDPRVGVVFCDTWVCRTEDTSTPMMQQVRQRDPLRARLCELFTGRDGTTAEALFFQPSDYPFNWIPSPTPLVRRKYFDEGLRFPGPPELNVQFEDWAMWLALSLKCEFVALPEPASIYRMHDTQYCAKMSRGGRIAGIRGLGDVYRWVFQTCAHEIASLGWRDRIVNRYADFLSSQVMRGNAEEQAAVLQCASEWRCVGRVRTARWKGRLNNLHYAIRNSQPFQLIRPALRWLRNTRDASGPELK
jgi:glycosyltransferase involved in cell wall biosynthesis